MKKMYVTPVVRVMNMEPVRFIAGSSDDDWVNSKKFKGTNFGSESSFQNDGTFGGQKSPWEEND